MSARPLYVVMLMLAALGLVLSWSVHPRTDPAGMVVHHDNGWTCQYRHVGHKTLTTCKRGHEYVRMYGLRGDRLR